MRPLICISWLMLSACSPRPEPAPYVKLSQVEATYGRMLTAANHPTAEQNGTGGRIGLFLDGHGELWGLPLDLEADGTILACAPSGLHGAKETDTYPAGASIIGATNAPTGDHGGTGRLEILLRDKDGVVSRRAVRGAKFEGGRACVASQPGPRLELNYYRLAPVP
jgi:hypothetical protein